jgi:hypothetical protein
VGFEIKTTASVGGERGPRRDRPWAHAASGDSPSCIPRSTKVANLNNLPSLALCSAMKHCSNLGEFPVLLWRIRGAKLHDGTRHAITLAHRRVCTALSIILGPNPSTQISLFRHSSTVYVIESSNSCLQNHKPLVCPRLQLTL